MTQLRRKDALTSPIDSIVTVVGNPKARSRTRAAAEELSKALTAGLSAGGLPIGEEPTVDLADVASGLLAPWSLSPAAAGAVERVRSSSVLVLATPTYKGSYTGMLKLLLDVLPAGGLDRSVVVPLVTAGGPAHRHLADLALRPVLVELGATVPVPSLLVLESELAGIAEITAGYAARHSSVIAAAVRARAEIA